MISKDFLGYKKHLDIFQRVKNQAPGDVYNNILLTNASSRIHTEVLQIIHSKKKKSLMGKSWINIAQMVNKDMNECLTSSGMRKMKTTAEQHCTPSRAATVICETDTTKYLEPPQPSYATGRSRVSATAHSVSVQSLSRVRLFATLWILHPKFVILNCYNIFSHSYLNMIF